MFGNDLATICKRKVALKLKKLAHVAIFILDLSKVLMYELHCDYITLSTDTDGWCMKWKPQNL